MYSMQHFIGKKISLKRKTVIMCLPMNLVMLCSAWETNCIHAIQIHIQIHVCIQGLSPRPRDPAPSPATPLNIHVHTTRHLSEMYR